MPSPRDRREVIRDQVGVVGPQVVGLAQQSLAHVEAAHLGLGLDLGRGLPGGVREPHFRSSAGRAVVPASLEHLQENRAIRLHATDGGEVGRRVGQQGDRVQEPLEGVSPHGLRGLQRQADLRQPRAEVDQGSTRRAGRRDQALPVGVRPARDVQQGQRPCRGCQVGVHAAELCDGQLGEFAVTGGGQVGAALGKDPGDRVERGSHVVKTGGVQRPDGEQVEHDADGLVDVEGGVPLPGPEHVQLPPDPSEGRADQPVIDACGAVRDVGPHLVPPALEGRELVAVARHGCRGEVGCPARRPLDPRDIVTGPGLLPDSPAPEGLDQVPHVRPLHPRASRDRNRSRYDFIAISHP